MTSVPAVNLTLAISRLPSFFNSLLGLVVIVRVCLGRFLVRLRLRLELERREHREVIRADVSQPLQPDEREGRLVEVVVQRPTEDRVPRMKRVEGAATSSGIERCADPLELTRGVRSSHIIEIARHDRRPAIRRDLLSDDQDFGVPLMGVRLHLRRPRVDSVELDPLARAQAQACAHGGDVILDQEPNLGRAEIQLGEEMHAV